MKVSPRYGVQFDDRSLDRYFPRSIQQQKIKKKGKERKNEL